MVAGQRRGRAIAMTAAELDLFLGGQRTCRFATVGPGGPHVSPVWFVWDGGALWVYSLTRSQRWADLQRDPRVAAVIDQGHHYHELHGVEIEGEAVVVGPVPRTGDADGQAPGVAELADPERLMGRKYFGSAQMTHDGRHAWLRITPMKITSWDFRKLAGLPPRPVPDAPPPVAPLPWICTGPYGRREIVMSDEVLVERRDAVQVIVINRPEARNALNGAVAAGVRDAVDELDRVDELRAGVLTGAGGTFSSGMDLKAFLAGESPAFPGRGLCGITQTPPRKPLVAAVEGWALAAGLELLLACDLVVAGASARFGVPEVKRSLVAAAGGALLLAQRVPRALALELLLTGDPIDAGRAAEIGLVNRVVEEGGALAAAVELASRIAANGPLAIAATKEIAYRAADWTAAERWQQAAKLVQPVFTSQDAREGARAFAEKRAPVWKGR